MTYSLQIEALKKNDPKAYSEMFDAHFKGLFLLACNMVFREDVAYDIVQDVFINIYEKADSLHEEASLKPYLYRSVRNRCYNYLRDRKVEDRRLMLYAEACLASDSLDMIEQEELLIRVREFLETLPGQCREVCRMRVFENRSFEEIADRLGITENTVRVQLHRGIKKLHAYFEQYGPTAMLYISFLTLLWENS